MVEVNRGPEGAGPRVEVKQDSSCQGKQGEDGRGWERGEQELEEEFHRAGMEKKMFLLRITRYRYHQIHYFSHSERLNSAADIFSVRSKST